MDYIIKFFMILLIIPGFYITNAFSSDSLIAHKGGGEKHENRGHEGRGEHQEGRHEEGNRGGDLHKEGYNAAPHGYANVKVNPPPQQTIPVQPPIAPAPYHNAADKK